MTQGVVSSLVGNRNKGPRPARDIIIITIIHTCISSLCVKSSCLFLTLPSGLCLFRFHPCLCFCFVIKGNKREMDVCVCTSLLDGHSSYATPASVWLVCCLYWMCAVGIIVVLQFYDCCYIVIIFNKANYASKILGKKTPVLESLMDTTHFVNSKC